MEDWIASAPRVPDAAASADLPALVAAARPVVLRGIAAGWPAVAAARDGAGAMADYLRRFDGGRPLGLFVGPPEIGGRFFYRDDLAGFNFERGEVTLGALLDALAAAAGRDDPPALYAGSSLVSQHFSGWTAANPTPLPIAAAEPRLWIGNGSRVSAHFDMADNVAVVVSGRRRVVLFPPDAAGDLYVGPFDTTMAGQPTSMVDIERPDPGRYPRFAQAAARATVAELSPGDALLIPAMWWHEIRATGPLGVLVNYWWTRGPPDTAFAALVHAILAVRDRPAPERAALRAWFDHWVFGEDAAHAADHLPPAARGLLGPPSPARDERARAYLRRMLAGRADPDPIAPLP